MSPDGTGTGATLGCSPAQVFHDGSWSYWRSGIRDIGDFGCPTMDRDAGLRAHFHDEVQITMVLSGYRSFVLERREVVCLPGRCIVIPAGAVHTPLPGPEAICLNAYVSDGSAAIGVIISEFEEMPACDGKLRPDELACLISRRLAFLQDVRCERGAAAGLGRPSPIRQAAGWAVMSREGFSRRFTRLNGMPPHAFGMMMRLNAARRLLRAGQDVAGAAAQAGFADQSHLGRLFRKAFGTTPARYRRGSGVTTVPD